VGVHVSDFADDQGRSVSRGSLLIFLFGAMASVFPMIYQSKLRWPRLLGPFMLFVPGVPDDNDKKSRNNSRMSIFLLCAFGP
jgi:hypothetical protein